MFFHIHAPELRLPIGLTVDTNNIVIAIDPGSQTEGLLKLGDEIVSMDGHTLVLEGLRIEEAVEPSWRTHTIFARRRRRGGAAGLGERLLRAGTRCRGLFTTQRVLLLLVALHAAFAISRAMSTMPTLTELRYELWAYRGKPTRPRPVESTAEPAPLSTDGMDPSGA